ALLVCVQFYSAISAPEKMRLIILRLNNECSAIATYSESIGMPPAGEQSVAGFSPIPQIQDNSFTEWCLPCHFFI
uniref:hypothetical protein n=1 Tax=Escherichia coli TaxID=562 RepID=UPI001BDCC175